MPFVLPDPQLPTTPFRILCLPALLFLFAFTADRAGAEEALLLTLPDSLAAQTPADGADGSAIPGLAPWARIDSERSRSRSDEVTDWFTEFFSEGDFNLEYKSLTLVPAANPNGYVATVDSAFQYPVPLDGNAVNLGLGDDDAIAVDISPKTFPFNGVNYSTIYVSTNGIITFTGPNFGSNPSFATHFNTPRISAFHADLQPEDGGGAGAIYKTVLSDRLVVTYDGIKQFGPPNINNFQVELFHDGPIRITWLGMQTRRGLVGISRGGGVPELLFQSNLRLYPTFGPFAALPVEPVRFLATETGELFPSAHPVTLIRKADSISTWSASASAPWLEVEPGLGNFAGSDRVQLKLRPTAAVASLEPGVHLASATFMTSGISVGTTIAVRLEVTESDIALQLADTTTPADDQTIPFGNVPLHSGSSEQLTLDNTSAELATNVTGIVIDGSYQEDFEDNLAQGWVPRVRAGGGQEWRVENGRYLAGPSDLTTGVMESSYSLQTFRDVVVEATIEHTGWDSSFAYIAIRGKPTGSNSLTSGTAYLFGITGNNGFTAFRIVNGNVQSILATSLSPAVTTPPFSNRVRVEATGPVLLFYVNGYYVGGVVDTAISGPGRVGFVVSSVASTDGLFKPAYAFDDIRVRRIPDGTNAFRLSGLPNFPAFLPPGDELAFDVLASPDLLGPAMATGRLLTTNSLRPEIHFFLYANGTPPHVGTLEVTSTAPSAGDVFADFEDQLAGTSSQESITVGNSSDEYPLEIESVVLMNRITDTFEDPDFPGWVPANAANWSHSDSTLVANPNELEDLWISNTWFDGGFTEGRLTVTVEQEPEDPTSFYVFVRGTLDFQMAENGAAVGSAIMVGSNSLGLFNITAFVSGDFRYLQTWFFTDAIHTDGTPNEITLEHIDDRIRVAFNGIEVFDGPSPPFIPFGSRSGIFAGTGPEGRSYRIHSAKAEGSTVPGAFSVSGIPFLPTSLSANGSIPLTAKFLPQNEGAYEGVLRVRSNDFINPLQRFEFAGTGFVVPFDFNGDGIVNVEDVTLLANYVTGKISELPGNKDVNEDGVVDMADVLALAAMIVE